MCRMINMFSVAMSFYLKLAKYLPSQSCFIQMELVIRSSKQHWTTCFIARLFLEMIVWKAFAIVFAWRFLHGYLKVCFEQFCQKWHKMYFVLFFYASLSVHMFSIILGEDWCLHQSFLVQLLNGDLHMPPVHWPTNILFLKFDNTNWDRSDSKAQHIAEVTPNGLN